MNLLEAGALTNQVLRVRAPLPQSSAPQIGNIQLLHPKWE